MRIPENLNKQRGLSLVELMVGLTIGLIALLIMSQVVSIQSAQKQTTSSGSDAQTAGAIALFTLERDARMAGFGVNGLPLLGCMVSGHYEGETSDEDFQFSFVPLFIETGAASDSLTISYGTSDGGLTPARLLAAHAGGTADYQLDSRFGIHVGNLVIVADNTDHDGDGVSDCAMVQVTGLPTASGQINNVSSNGNLYLDPRTQTSKPANYNKPGGLGIPFSANARFYNMGVPMSHTYTVDAGTAQLIMCDNMFGGPPRAIADGIVALRAQYGKDTDNDGSVDLYDTAAPANPADWAQVIALRVAMVARSAQREVGMVSAASLKLWPDLALASGATASGPTMPLTDEQRHYRYRVFQTLVPLRNQIWKIPGTSSG
jgi:type IV pilus assembly protein PilW